jgi:hypothetical protein
VKTLHLTLIALILMVPAMGQDKSPDSVAVVAATMSVMPCAGQGDPTNVHQ